MYLPGKTPSAPSVNGVKEGVGTQHVEALGGMEVVDTLDEGPALCYE